MDVDVDISLLVEETVDDRVHAGEGSLRITLAVIGMLLAAFLGLAGIFYVSGTLFQLSTSDRAVDYDLLTNLSFGAMVVPAALLILVLGGGLVLLGMCSLGYLDAYRAPGRWVRTTLE
jgi:hypothetical protein